MGVELGFTRTGFPGGVKSGAKAEQRDESGTEKGQGGISLRRTMSI